MIDKYALRIAVNAAKEAVSEGPFELAVEFALHAYLIAIERSSIYPRDALRAAAKFLADNGNEAGAAAVLEAAYQLEIG